MPIPLARICPVVHDVYEGGGGWWTGPEKEACELAFLYIIK